MNRIRPNHLSASPAFIFFQGSLTWMYWLPWREMLRMCFRESRILMKYLEKNGIKWQASSTYITVLYRSSPMVLLILRCWVEQNYKIVLIDSNNVTSLNNTFNHATLLITFKPMLKALHEPLDRIRNLTWLCPWAGCTAAAPRPPEPEAFYLPAAAPSQAHSLQRTWWQTCRLWGGERRRGLKQRVRETRGDRARETWHRCLAC